MRLTSGLELVIWAHSLRVGCRRSRLTPPRTVSGWVVEQVEGVDTCPYCYPYTLYSLFFDLFPPLSRIV
jgi:hypothetical protein